MNKFFYLFFIGAILLLLVFWYQASQNYGFTDSENTTYLVMTVVFVLILVGTFFYERRTRNKQV